MFKMQSFLYRQNIRKSLSNFDKLSEVSIHFNSPNHSMDDLKFFIFKSNLHDKIKRLSTENYSQNLDPEIGHFWSKRFFYECGTYAILSHMGLPYIPHNQDMCKGHFKTKI
ncbi:hypothetical protein BpHYR1_019606 [Brachionus plicatilis]|uniref:Uncharacterized protein n=1 Tax=Brachionus plicatilis TaxID=10195 RepID=A0A3M7P1W9_BRAPC|nr:hypothetical protein BpHYR1_019606 [Brachionus plicatilis]